MITSNVREINLSKILYVSRAVLPVGGDVAAVDHIVKVSIQRNASLNISGALIYSGLHFAQILEGPSFAVGELMASIQRDGRHRDVTVIANHRITSRNFGRWAMAYAGTSPYIDRLLKRLLSPSTSVSQKTRKAKEVIAEMERLT